eukprot:TRINITY_DN55329_c0_g1_i1.p1 TRINITY_DN55329_c0_g1~~TRINITY_DN55329_c0_g1_i1.p1  ORF type:complete len:560 (+),score=150.26 TRINITY_DN55329_c0_g1_i1:82-1680(+)
MRRGAAPLAAVLAAALAAGAAAEPSAARQQPQCGAPQRYDVIIIGAGAAGGAAAAELRAAGVSYAVLEATSRTGGRVEAFRFGDPAVRDVVLERGANWVSGAPLRGPGANPVFNAAERLGLSMLPVPGSAGNLSGWELLNSRGQKADPKGAMRRRVGRLADCVNRTASAAERDMSVAEALRGCGWGGSAESPEERALMWQPFSGQSGEPPEVMSLWGVLPDLTYAFWGPDDFFVKDQHPRGYARVLDALSGAALSDSDCRTRLFLNATVSNVAVGCRGVTVEATDGRRWHADRLISTVSIGVLKTFPGLFTPALPAAHAAALRHYHMCNYTKVWAQWREPWWDNSMLKWMSANSGENAGLFPSWRNLNHRDVLPGSNTLFFDLAEPQSVRWEKLTDAEAEQELLRVARERFPDRDIPPPAAFHTTRHGLDPLTVGAYSSWGVGMTDEDLAELMRPLRAHEHCSPRVWLSGEATCGNFNGFVHAGVLSGRRDAQRVLHAMGKGPAPESLCDAHSTRLRGPRWRGPHPAADLDR